MRDGPDPDVLLGVYSWTPKVSSWLGTTLLADSVPVVSGTVSYDVSQMVPERLTFIAPSEVNGQSWIPQTAYDPLARYGQYVDVSIEVTSSLTGTVWDVRIGRFQIQDWTADDVSHQISVECVGLLQRPADAKHEKPTGPRSGGTLVSEFSRLMVPGIPVQVDGGLQDRIVPKSFTYSDDRLGNLYEIADAWPARIRVDSFGVLRLLPPLPTLPGAPVMTFTDGKHGQVVNAPTTDTRDQQYNIVIARSSLTDDPTRAPIQGSARVVGGPMDPDGPYGKVVRFWSSPLAATSQQLSASAQYLLDDGLRHASVVTVECAPDPRVEVDDVVTVTRGTKLQLGWEKHLKHVNLVPNPRTKGTSLYTAPSNSPLTTSSDGWLRMTETATGSAYCYPRWSAGTAYYPAPVGTRVAVRALVRGMPGKTTYANLVVQGYTSAAAGDVVAGQSGMVAIPAGSQVVIETFATVTSAATTQILPLLRFYSSSAGAQPAINDYLDSTKWYVETGLTAPTASPITYFDGASKRSGSSVYSWSGAVDGSPSLGFQRVRTPVVDDSEAITDTGWVIGYDLPLTVSDGSMKIKVGVIA